MGEAKRRSGGRDRKLVTTDTFGPITLDTFAGELHVEWDPAAAVTPRRSDACRYGNELRLGRPMTGA